MEEIFEIGEEGSHALFERQMRDFLKWFIVFIAALFVLLIWIGKFKKALLVSSGMTGLILFAFSFRKKHFKMLRYKINPDRFIQFVNSENANMLVQIARARNERRYGAKDEKEVVFDKIDKIIFKASGDIYVYSTVFDIFTNNGRIIFYHEMKNFNQIKTFIQGRFSELIKHE